MKFNPSIINIHSFIHARIGGGHEGHNRGVHLCHQEHMAQGDTGRHSYQPTWEKQGRWDPEEERPASSHHEGSRRSLKKSL